MQPQFSAKLEATSWDPRLEAEMRQTWDYERIFEFKPSNNKNRNFVMDTPPPYPSGKPWHPGALFHVSTRYPRKPHAAGVDRLAGILRNGLLAPAHCPDGSVCSDLNLVVTGTAVPYDSLVFLHRFGPQSFLYTLGGPGRFSVFVDPAIPVLTPEAMGAGWVVLCQDEVYVRGRIAPEDLTGVAVHHADADSVVGDLIADFRRL
ncbi:MAG: hypothetical protein OK436_05380, partial [Thaumarchaeota archaeon]|nr:hypothetical protein [Nitrososphaerota archaeon]